MGVDGGDEVENQHVHGHWAARCVQRRSGVHCPVGQPSHDDAEPTASLLPQFAAHVPLLPTPIDWNGASRQLEHWGSKREERERCTAAGERRQECGLGGLTRRLSCRSRIHGASTRSAKGKCTYDILILFGNPHLHVFVGQHVTVTLSHPTPLQALESRRNRIMKVLRLRNITIIIIIIIIVIT